VSFSDLKRNTLAVYLTFCLHPLLNTVHFPSPPPFLVPTHTQQSNILVSRGPRKMTVLLPSVRADGTRTTFQPLKEDESMLAQCVLNRVAHSFIALTFAHAIHRPIHALTLHMANYFPNYLNVHLVDSLIARYAKAEETLPGCSFLRNKTPKWNERASAFCQAFSSSRLVSSCDSMSLSLHGFPICCMYFIAQRSAPMC
jgi:hypothetical protein